MDTDPPAVGSAAEAQAGPGRHPRFALCTPTYRVPDAGCQVAKLGRRRESNHMDIHRRAQADHRACFMFSVFPSPTLGRRWSGELRFPGFSVGVQDTETYPAG